MPAGEAEAVLLAAWQAEVEWRGGKFRHDANTAEACRRLAKFLTQPQGCKTGAMLCGTPGNGKTTLLRAMQAATNWLEARQVAVEYGKGIRIMPARDIAEAAKDWKTFTAIRTHPALGIEDMGCEAAEVANYGNWLNPVADLVEFRYDRCLPTFMTTNLTPAEVRKRYGARVADRFNEMLEVIIFTRGSYRGK